MPRRFIMTAAAALAGLVLGIAPAAAVAAPASCTSCHPDVSRVLPNGHPAVAKAASLSACVGCHKSSVGVKDAKPEPNKFAAALHRAHAKEGSAADCTTCHVARAKGKPGVAGGKVVLPVTAERFDALKKAMVGPGQATFTAGFHAAANVSCNACHEAIPSPGDEVANVRCLACHGPQDALESKTAPAQFADRNPHRSHLGDIACSVCHKGHEASVVYCLDCHRKFEMKIKGAAAH